ncbi:MAG: peptidoglycan-binding protein [Myxococcales bacterium]|nr:peptidoglycan-binding protein [Myxococcales bacterium]
MRRPPLTVLFALATVSLAAGCEELAFGEEPAEPSAETTAGEPTEEPDPEPEPEHHARVDARPPPLAHPVPLFEEGAAERDVDAATASEDGYLLLDLGESWTPYLFTEQSNPDEPRVEHAYRETYLALARGELPADHHGARAERDKYLELYGIMPSLGLLRQRFRHMRDLECREGLDLSALDSFDGFVRYTNNGAARNAARRFLVVERSVAAYVSSQGVESESDLDESRLDDRQQRTLREYRENAPRVFAVRAAQARLECEGYFEGKGDYVRGGLDWATHEALAEFERRHRIYGWGFIGNDTLDALRQSSLELERRAVVRVLTERAVHSLGVIEDGSAEGSTYRGADNTDVPIPNLEAQVEEQIVEALGLATPESTLDFLEGLGELSVGEERVVAVRAPELPPYYSSDMSIRVEIDRGDVWYEFPYDEEGHERGQPVQRRPRLSVFVRYRGHDVRLARFGTTIGGWRSEEIDGSIWWRYKNSPPGPRVWENIVSAPVWMPPPSTPSRDLMVRVARRSGADAYRVNLHETGPSYASAYGLVAAYHRLYSEDEDGNLEIRGDEGIRTHGSVDYMSIMRRHSHGCHRLHNHIAVRLMSWVLAHRTHSRVGHQVTAFHRSIEHEGHNYQLDIERGGYVFQLERPIKVSVLEGRIRGTRATPIETPLPRFDSELGAYVNPAGEAFSISRTGAMTPVILPDASIGLPDGGLPEPTIVNPFTE